MQIRDSEREKKTLIYQRSERFEVELFRTFRRTNDTFFNVISPVFCMMFAM